MTNDSILPADNDGGDHDFEFLFDATEAAAEQTPLPKGRYIADIVQSGEHIASTGSRSYKLTFEVQEPAEHAGRRIWHDIWLTLKALPYAKRELAKLGIESGAQLRESLPAIVRCSIAVVIERDDDDDVGRNRVRDFRVLKVLQDPFDFGEEDVVDNKDRTQDGDAPEDDR
jgi:hypothetical protein